MFPKTKKIGGKNYELIGYSDKPVGTKDGYLDNWLDMSKLKESEKIKYSFDSLRIIKKKTSYALYGYCHWWGLESNWTL